MPCSPPMAAALVFAGFLASNSLQAEFTALKVDASTLRAGSPNGARLLSTFSFRSSLPAVSTAVVLVGVMPTARWPSS